MQLTLIGANGTATLASTAGLTFSTGTGTANTTMTFSGTISSLNAALNGMSFNPTNNFSGGATLQLTTNDFGNFGTGGPLTDTDTVSITVSAPTAANVTVSGRVVNAAGNGIRGARVAFFASNGTVRTAITNAFGNYTFTDIPSGDTYIGKVAVRGLVFVPRVIVVKNALTGVDFRPQ